MVNVISHYNWQNQKLNLKSYWFLKNIFIFGHAANDKPLITDNYSKKITPTNLILTSNINLYLLVCHQGNLNIKTQWADIGRISITNIYGADNTTETIISTLFLIHLHADKFKKNEYWFKVWLEANDFYRKDFKIIRQTYIECNLIYTKTIENLKKFLNYEKFKHFLDVDYEYEQYLNGIIGKVNE